MFDAFSGTSDSPIAPASRCFAITPADGTDLVRVTKAIYVGTGGDISLVPVGDDQAVLFRNVPSGSVIDVRVARVNSTATTADDIVGLA